MPDANFNKHASMTSLKDIQCMEGQYLSVNRTFNYISS